MIEAKKNGTGKQYFCLKRKRYGKKKHNEGKKFGVVKFTNQKMVLIKCGNF